MMNENMKNMEINEKAMEQAAGGNGWNSYGMVSGLTYGCLTVRNAPNGTTLGGLLNGDMVTILDFENGWYKVYADCKALGYPNNTRAYSGIGYVNGMYITVC